MATFTGCALGDKNPSLDEQVAFILGEADNDLLLSLALNNFPDRAGEPRIRVVAKIITDGTPFVWRFREDGGSFASVDQVNGDSGVAISASDVDWDLLSQDLVSHSEGCQSGGRLDTSFLPNGGLISHVVCMDGSRKTIDRITVAGSSRVDGQTTPDEFDITSPTHMQAALDLAAKAYPEGLVYGIRVTSRMSARRGEDPRIAFIGGEFGELTTAHIWHRSFELRVPSYPNSDSFGVLREATVFFGAYRPLDFDHSAHANGPLQMFSLSAITAADLAGIWTDLQADGVTVDQMDVLEVTRTDGNTIASTVKLKNGHEITNTLATT